jgi:hypothetical protein
MGTGSGWTIGGGAMVAGGVGAGRTSPNHKVRTRKVVSEKVTAKMAIRRA